MNALGVSILLMFTILHMANSQCYHSKGCKGAASYIRIGRRADEYSPTLRLPTNSDEDSIEFVTNESKKHLLRKILIKYLENEQQGSKDSEELANNIDLDKYLQI